MVQPENTTEFIVETPKNVVSIMDPNRFEVVTLDQTSAEFRLHRLGAFYRSFQLYAAYLLRTPERMSEVLALDKNLRMSEKAFTPEEIRKMAAIMAEQDTKVLIESLHTGDRDVSEYIGQDGEGSNQYQKGEAKVLESLLTLPQEAKILLSFEKDAICEIIKSGDGFQSHCSSKGVTQDDMYYWYAVNREANLLLKENDENSKNLGLVRIGEDRYSVWVRADLIRNRGFLGSVLEGFFAIKDPS